MGEKTGIGWTDCTMNFWWGCTRVSAECDNCYIERWMKFQGIKDPFAGPIRLKDWQKPFAWDRKAARDGVRRRVFTCSMSDFFHQDADRWRDEAWDVIRRCTNLDWLILTKRPKLVPKRLPKDWGDGWPHVWLGTTCGVRKSLPRVELLLDLPAAIRFVSAEPLLEPIDFRPYLDRLDWIITGCETAAKRKLRRMELDWVRDIDQQCKEFSVAHFFKQYWADGSLCEDGVLDGVKQQEWPKTPVLLESALQSFSDERGTRR